MQNKKNLQKVYFKISDKYYQNCIDLKQVYSSVHAQATGYGSSANMLINEMLANLLELALQKKLDILKPFIITDFGCGRSKAANILAELVAENSEEIANMLASGSKIGEIIQSLSSKVAELDAKEISSLDRVMSYKHITVQRYDLGIPEFSTKPEQRADIVFCNDVMEHIPQDAISSFVTELTNAGQYVVASISLRDAVNYMAVPEKLLIDNAVEVDVPKSDGIVLTKDISGDFIFSLHVSVFPKEKWQNILGDGWFLLDAQDYTACSAMNFEPTEEYKAFKKELIAQIGFADFISFPTILGSRYEKDPILYRRTALMQPEKHLRKLNVLEEYPESDFKQREQRESLAFLTYIGAQVEQDENGQWQLISVPDNLLDRLTELEKASKIGANTDADVRENAKKIINF